MSKPPFIIRNRKGIKLWPQTMQLPAMTHVHFAAEGLTGPEIELAREIARQALTDNEGRLKQFYLRMSNAYSDGITNVSNRTVQMAPNMIARYSNIAGHERMDVKFDARGIIEDLQTKKDEPILPQRGLYITVMDESDSYDGGYASYIDSSWLLGRARNPNLLTVVLWPGIPGGGSWYDGGPYQALHLPSSFPGNNGAGPYTVGRVDGGSLPYPADWWTLTGLIPAEFSDIWLQVDTSGSMTPYSVADDIVMFYRKAVGANPNVMFWYCMSPTENVFVGMPSINRDARSTYTAAISSPEYESDSVEWERIDAVGDFEVLF